MRTGSCVSCSPIIEISRQRRGRPASAALQQAVVRSWKASKRRPARGSTICCRRGWLRTNAQWLDQLFASGEVVWGRLQPPRPTDDSRGQMLTRAVADLARCAGRSRLAVAARPRGCRQVGALGRADRLRSAASRTAHCSSTTCWRRRSCCRRNWKMRCANWRHWGW